MNVLNEIKEKVTFETEGAKGISKFIEIGGLVHFFFVSVLSNFIAAESLFSFLPAMLLILKGKFVKSGFIVNVFIGHLRLHFPKLCTLLCPSCKSIAHPMYATALESSLLSFVPAMTVWNSILVQSLLPCWCVPLHVPAEWHGMAAKYLLLYDKASVRIHHRVEFTQFYALMELAVIDNDNRFALVWYLCFGITA